MARHKNVNWNLSVESAGHTVPHNDVTQALLMDVRDELQMLNRLLHCANFTGIPDTLREIRENTKKRRRKPSLKLVRKRA